MKIIVLLLCSILVCNASKFYMPTKKEQAGQPSNADFNAEDLDSTSVEELSSFLENCEISLNIDGRAEPIVFRFEVSKFKNDTHTCWHNGEVVWPLCSNQPKGFNVWHYVNSAKFVRCAVPLYCESEAFSHYYRRRNNKMEKFENSWKRAKAGERSGLHGVCLKSNGVSVTRKCLFNTRKQKAEWENISHWPDVVCVNETREHIVTPELNLLHDEIIEGKLPKNTTLQRHQILTNVRKLLRERTAKQLPADVHLTKQLLASLTDTEKDAGIAQDVMEICNNVMSMDSLVLRTSGVDLNATNGLVDTFETYIDALTAQTIPQSRCGIQTQNSNNLQNSDLPKIVESLDMAHIGVYALLSSNLSVYFVNPKCTNISGIAVYNPQTKISRKPLTPAPDNSFLYRFIYMNETANDLLQEAGLEIATFIPLSLWQKLEQNTLLLQAKHSMLVIKLYAHDGLFVENSQLLSRKPFSKVLSLTITEHKGLLPAEFPFILRYKPDPSNSGNVTQGSGCGYWNYTTWASDGVQTKPSKLQEADLILCSTSHLTSFSYLLGGSYRQNDLEGGVLITPLQQELLDIITIIGCTLSLLGLLGIWLTAIIFKSWRSQASTKVLLNLCFALTLQMTLFVFINTDDMSEHLIQERSFLNCVVLGAAMQYSILVLFSWMLIAAYLQFQRYVKVIGIQRPSHYILKSAVAAWGFPFIPTLLVAFIDPHSYIPTDYQLRSDTGICYPSGHGLLFGVIIPVSLIILANFSIFIYVCWSISHELSQSMLRQERKMVIAQIRLSVLLFFLLGLTWIFGLLAFMKAGIAFSYLFCVTATMQGFVLFIYFVVLDKNTRNAWCNLLCPRNSQKVTELQSMTSTASTSK